MILGKSTSFITLLRNAFEYQKQEEKWNSRSANVKTLEILTGKQTNIGKALFMFCHESHVISNARFLFRMIYENFKWIGIIFLQRDHSPYTCLCAAGFSPFYLNVCFILLLHFFCNFPNGFLRCCTELIFKIMEKVDFSSKTQIKVFCLASVSS